MARRGLLPGDQRLEVRHPREAGRALVKLGLAGAAVQRRIAAVARPEDADALGIDAAFGDQLLHPVGQVVLHLGAPLAVAGLGEGAAIA